MIIEKGGMKTFFRKVRHSESPLIKAIRFGGVGVVSGLIFAIVTLCAARSGLEPKLASVAGYVVSIPVNFLFNRCFSFRSENSLLSDFPRFLFVHACNMVVTAFAMGTMVDVLGLHYFFGVVTAIALVPVASFLAMNGWVFRTRLPVDTPPKKS